MIGFTMRRHGARETARRQGNGAREIYYKSFMIFSLNSEFIYSKTFLFNKSFNLNFVIMKTLKYKIENKKQ